VVGFIDLQEIKTSVTIRPMVRGNNITRKEIPNFTSSFVIQLEWIVSRLFSIMHDSSYSVPCKSRVQVVGLMNTKFAQDFTIYAVCSIYGFTQLEEKPLLTKTCKSERDYCKAILAHFSHMYRGCCEIR